MLKYKLCYKCASSKITSILSSAANVLKATLVCIFDTWLSLYYCLRHSTNSVWFSVNKPLSIPWHTVSVSDWSEIIIDIAVKHHPPMTIWCWFAIWMINCNYNYIYVLCVVKITISYLTLLMSHTALSLLVKQSRSQPQLQPAESDKTYAQINGKLETGELYSISLLLVFNLVIWCWIITEDHYVLEGLTYWIAVLPRSVRSSLSGKSTQDKERSCWSSTAREKQGWILMGD